MTSNKARRITKELADIRSNSNDNAGIHAEAIGDDLSHLKGSFEGPPGTCYEGGSFDIDIKIPAEYPFRPPIMKFATKIWHPNISSQTVRD